MGAEETYAVDHAYRRKLNKVRKSVTHSIRVGDLQVYMQCGEYPDGSLGEIFLTASKQGSLVGALLDAFSVAVSIGLQYGVPLESLAAKFIGMKFEPHGNTDDEDIAQARSVLDYIFKRLALDYLPPEVQRRVGIEESVRHQQRDGVGWQKMVDLP